MTAGNDFDPRLRAGIVFRAADAHRSLNRTGFPVLMTLSVQ